MMEEEVNATLYPLWAKIVTTHGAFIRRFVISNPGIEICSNQLGVRFCRRGTHRRFDSHEQ